MVKKRVLIDCRFLGESGIGRYTEEILYELNTTDLELTLLGNKSKIKEFYNGNANYLKFDHKPLSISEQFGYLKIRQSFDAFWIPHINIPIFTKLAKKNICTLHDLTPLKGWNAWKQKIYFIVLLIAIKIKGYTVIYDTHYIKKKTSFIGFKRTRVVHLAPKNIFIQKNRSNSSSGNQHEAYALCVGNLKPHKNLKVVIDAWNLDEELSRRYNLKIVGTGNLRTNNKSDLIRSAESNPSISFLGKVDDKELARLYSKASIFLMPSLSEGFGLPVLEAQSSGVTVICSNASCLPEVGGDGCIYFSPKNTKELCRIIKNYKFDMDLIERGYSNSSKYSWKLAASSLSREF